MSGDDVARTLEARSGTLQLLLLGAGLLFGLGSVNLLEPGKRDDFENLALAAGTGVVYPSVDVGPIHCRYVGDAEECIATHREAGACPLPCGSAIPRYTA